MSVRLVTTPWLTKNFAGVALATVGSWHGRDGSADGTPPRPGPGAFRAGPGLGSSP